MDAIFWDDCGVTLFVIHVEAVLATDEHHNDVIAAKLTKK